MPAHRPVASGLLARARRGELTRRSARSPEERRAAYRVQYLARRAAAPDISAREALGHYGPLERPRVATFFADTLDEGGRLVTLEGVSAADQRRAGRYMRAAQGLARGAYRTPSGVWLTGANADRHFARRFARWQPIAGMRVVSNPATVKALVVMSREAGEEIAFDSGRSRPGRRRRTAAARRRARSGAAGRAPARPARRPSTARGRRRGTEQGLGVLDLLDEAVETVEAAVDTAAEAFEAIEDDLK